MVKPFLHTGRYFAQSWRDYLDHTPDELPIARPTIALAAQAFRDEIVLMGLKARRPVSAGHVFERIRDEVAAGVEFYGNRGWLAWPEDSLVIRRRSQTSRSARSRTADVPFIACTSTAAMPRTRANRVPNDGWDTPRTTASTHCCCATPNRAPGWYVCTGPKWVAPHWIWRFFGPGNCTTSSA
ncbi:hypothetical protein I547_5221 [Mycobacterium kansasii 824]|nr:hypothetical protein I547_5221 [Mycobacterium kansasii 824]